MKDDIRKEILRQRDSLTFEQLNSYSAAINDSLLSSNLYSSSNHIMTYLNFRSEVITDKLITQSLAKGKKIYVPVCVPETRELVISELHSLDDLEYGFYNIRQPKSTSLFIADRSLLDLVVVPGAAFDHKGNRIGYGAGYYDRFFKTCKTEIHKIALAYSFQVLDAVPSQPHDVTMDYIITEKGIADCRFGGIIHAF